MKLGFFFLAAALTGTSPIFVTARPETFRNGQPDEMSSANERLDHHGRQLSLRQFVDPKSTNIRAASSSSKVDEQQQQEQQISTYLPLIIGSGQGTTGTKSLFAATCELQLRSVHYSRHCGFATSKEAERKKYTPSPGLIAHERLLLASMALYACVSNNDPCPTVKEALDGMKKLLDAVIASPDVDVVHDSPYPEFTDYIIQAAERIRGVKPIILLSEREPKEWVESRIKHAHGLVCKLTESQVEGESLPVNPGENTQWCLETAMKQNMGEVPINEIFWVVSQMKHDEELRNSIMEGGLALYQDHVHPKATYSVNLFEHIPFLTSEELAAEIKEALIFEMGGSKVFKKNKFVNNRGRPVYMHIDKEKIHFA